MIHLITVVGESAGNFYLEPDCLSDFKSLMRTVTSGRVLIVSTKFRSDLFYQATKSRNKAILKLWALYAKTDLATLDRKGFTSSKGDEKSLSEYFQSINSLSTNWYQYRVYQKAFHYSFSNDQQNPMIKTVFECDQYLTGHPDIKRAPLVETQEKMNPNLTKDSFTLAMHIINNETHSN